jgi:transposase
VPGLADLKILVQKKVLKAAEQHRPDVVVQRAQWRLLQAGLDPARLVFLDETWAKTNLTRRYGRCPRGQRLVDHVPFGHWKTTTFVCALRLQGLLAPTVVDGAINGAVFLAYVRQQLVPALRSGDLVIMDNLGSHKVQGVCQAIEGAGAQVLYLPPYSPDLNPIELAFAKLKWLVCSAKERSVDGLWNCLGKTLDAFTEIECKRYLRHCGYAATAA